ncbi:helix-turn-helix transcriptional regulator [Paenibacillus beijingensis]|uniref:Transcriptional regulator n=1 Tax=Paenibacillus beijingensis TaxID=1126833 RepID=A0A0D5NH56_9BACL|nr:YafY family protein [Paenibacillus beijingensis]AJY74709.1 transcriptional regulator [Paenibacillus beijingensis]
MNKSDRMLAIMLELQRSGRRRAEDLAAAFETSVRTIYRDMQALSEAGVPVIGAPGQGYSLMEGYFLPPVSFTVEEAVALLIGTDFIEHNFDTGYGNGAKASRAKIEAILPETVRLEASRVRAALRLIKGREAEDSREKAHIETLRRAILEERKVSFRYSKKIPEADGSRQSDRTAAPYGLIFLYGAWVLIAHCDLRREIRHFRLSRMSGLKMLDDRFTFPSGFDLQRYRPADDRNQLVRIRVDAGIADKVKESNYFFIEKMEELADGLLVTLRVRQPEEVLQWVLGWGADVAVLEPEPLRNRVREEAEKMLKRY